LKWTQEGYDDRQKNPGHTNPRQWEKAETIKRGAGDTSERLKTGSTAPKGCSEKGLEKKLSQYYIRAEERGGKLMHHGLGGTPPNCRMHEKQENIRVRKKCVLAST